MVRCDESGVISGSGMDYAGQMLYSAGTMVEGDNVPSVEDCDKAIKSMVNIDTTHLHKGGFLPIN